MAQYTILSNSELQGVADHYILGNLKAFKVLEGGSQNTNYYLETTAGSFVLTVVEQHSVPEVEQLVFLLEHLRRHGFSTSRVIPNQAGEFVGQWGAKPSIVKDYVEGIILEDFPPVLLERLGKVLAQLHQIPAPNFLPRQLGYGIERFHELELYATGSDYEEWLHQQQQYLAPYLALNLPKRFIHSDVFDNNVVVATNKTELTIIDFEEAAYYYRLFDIGMTIVGVCRDEQKIDVVKVEHLLQGYQSVERLLAIEQESLQAFIVYAATAMSFWRHRNFNYTNPTPDKFKHYQELQNVANHVRSLPKDELLFQKEGL